jgi:predicted PhzF superfamily epimerase YddE/YHI9
MITNNDFETVYILTLKALEGFFCYDEIVTTAHVVRIFVNEQQEFGSLVGVVVDESAKISSEKRLRITKKLGFSETVFVNKLNPCDLSIYSKQGEIKFASPLLGAVWFVEQKLGKAINSFTCQGERIEVIHDSDLLWLRITDTSTLPPWKLEELPTPQDEGDLSSVNRSGEDHTLVWAWQDRAEECARVRARTFAPAWEIPEEEANGSGCMVLAQSLNSNIQVEHGKGSHVYSIVSTDGVAVGGRVCQVPDRFV